MAEPLLRIDGLSKAFGAVVACDNVALELPAGELHAVIGPNGAGKTTLLGQLAGEIRPDAVLGSLADLPTWWEGGRV